MINGYVNLPNSVKNIIENYFNNNVSEGNVLGVYNELVSLPVKPSVVKIHVDEFLGVPFNADFVIQPIIIKQKNYIDIQAFLFIKTPLAVERFIMAIAITVSVDDNFKLEGGLFQQVSLGGWLNGYV